MTLPTPTPSFFSKFTTKPKNSRFWLILLVFSLCSIAAMGRVGEDILTYGLWLYLSLYVLKRLSNKFFVAYLFFTFIVSAVYIPVAVMYGKLTKGVAFSLFETNMQESVAFMSSIDLKSISYLLLYIILFGCLLKINKQTKITQQRGKGFYILCVIVALSIISKPIIRSVKSQSVELGYLSSIKYYPLRQVLTFNHRVHEYLNNKKMMREAREIEPVWNFEDKTLKYNTYVLVIGESVRRDYMSAYGYPIDTTPFLAKANGTIFNNFISAGQNTRLSLERMLFQNTAIEKSVMSNTPVTLANSLDMDTYWLSNQGVYSDYDIFASAVAVRSDEVRFLNTGKEAMKNHSDLELQPIFEEILSRKKPLTDKNKNRLIVFHLVGSHWNFCERMDANYGSENITGFVNEDLSCYLSSYRQTDKLIENIYTKLQQQGDSFSLMYTADHGYAHKDRPITGMTLRHDTEYKQNYEVPFIVLSSDDTDRKYIDNQRSGYYFVNAFAEWLGVQERSLALEPKFFSDKDFDESIKVFNGEKVVEYESLENDPVIIE